MNKFPIREMNRQPVGKSKDGKIIFIRIPPSIAEPVDVNALPGHSACDCPYCKEHPLEIPRWDTLCVSPDGTGRTWTVHHPEEF